MGRLLGIITLVVGTLCAPVAAANPYFHGYAAAVALPGGDSGSLRRLYLQEPGKSEKVRIVVTDKRGDVRALGPVGYAAEFSCSGSRCSAYVYNDTSFLPDVYRFDPQSTKAVGILSAGAGSDLDLVMLARVTYGFAPVTGFVARVMGAFACLTQWWPSFIALLAIGMCALPAWLRLERAVFRRERLRSTVVGLLQAGAIMLVAGALYAAYLWTTTYPPLLSLVTVVLPTLVLLLQQSFRGVGEGPATASA